MLLASCVPPFASGITWSNVAGSFSLVNRLPHIWHFFWCFINFRASFFVKVPPTVRLIARRLDARIAAPNLAFSVFLYFSVIALKTSFPCAVLAYLATLARLDFFPFSVCRHISRLLRRHWWHSPFCTLLCEMCPCLHGFPVKYRLRPAIDASSRVTIGPSWAI